MGSGAAAANRKTKIVCTIGPATATSAGIRALVEAGMDVARLNFSHGDHDSHRETIRAVRAAAADLGRGVAILQDLCGPKIRLGEVQGGEVTLTVGDEVVLQPADEAVGDALPVAYPRLVEDVAAGERILLADGLVELRVERVADGRLVCEVVVGGVLASHKGVNLPGSSLQVPSFTDKDRRDLEVGLDEGVDLVALSFVRHEDDLAPVMDRLARSDFRPLVVAKIEKPQAVERFDRILARVDGVMVARGDLGVEMPVEQVPLIQKRIIAAARRAARPVITATQMLRSMVASPRPTRAEATDVANAVLDGTDAVMLSEETAVGRYPTEAVRVLDRIATAAEAAFETSAWLDEDVPESLPLTAGALSRAACVLARDVDAAAIVACTMSGSTARLVARLRSPVPVVALTVSERVERQLALSWGVLPRRTDLFASTDAMLDKARACVLQEGLARPGDRIVVTAGLPINVAGTTNLLRVLEVD